MHHCWKASRIVQRQKINYASVFWRYQVNHIKQRVRGKHLKTGLFSTSCWPLWGRRNYLGKYPASRSYIITALWPVILVCVLAVNLTSLVPICLYHIRYLLVDSTTQLGAWPWSGVCDCVEEIFNNHIDGASNEYMKKIGKRQAFKYRFFLNKLLNSVREVDLPL